MPANTGVARAMHRGVFFAGKPAPTLPLQPSPAPILCHLHLGKAQIPSNPRKTALKAQYFRAFQNWHAPCNRYCISSFGGLGTGRPGYPPLLFATPPVSGTSVQAGRDSLFYSQHRPFWGPRYRQAGTPSFIRNIARFGDLGTGRPRHPLFYSCSLTCTRQRPASSAAAHVPLRGRAATTVSTSPSSLCCKRQPTGLPCRFNCPRWALPSA